MSPVIIRILILFSFPGATSLAKTKEISRLLTDPLLDVWAVRANGSVDIRIVDGTAAGDKIQTELEKLFDRCDVRIPDVEQFVQTSESASSNVGNVEQQEWHEEYVRVLIFLRPYDVTALARLLL